MSIAEKKSCGTRSNSETGAVKSPLLVVTPDGGWMSAGLAIYLARLVVGILVLTSIVIGSITGHFGEVLQILGIVQLLMEGRSIVNTLRRS